MHRAVLKGWDGGKREVIVMAGQREGKSGQLWFLRGWKLGNSETVVL